MFTAIPAASDKNGTGGILDASLSVVNTIEVTSNEMSTVSEPDPTPVSDVPTLSFPSCMEEVEEARTVGRVFVALVMVCGLKKGEGGRAIRGFAQKEYKRALSSTGTPLTFSRCLIQRPASTLKFTGMVSVANDLHTLLSAFEQRQGLLTTCALVYKSPAYEISFSYSQ